MKVAVLDLGTNTYQLGLYIVEPGPNLILIEEDEVFVKMTKESNTAVTPAVQKRAHQALKRFIHQIDAYNPDKVLAVGTEAFRQLKGGDHLKAELEEQLEHPIHIISGEEEATWTCVGVQHALGDLKDFLLMDIGGGSTEFTLVKNGQVQTAMSFPIGAAVLAERFDAFDRLTQEKKEQAAQWLEEQLEPLWKAIGTNHPVLVGTSGSFETIPELLQPGKSFGEICGVDKKVVLSPSEVENSLGAIMESSLDGRLQWPGLKPARAEYFLMAAYSVQYVVKKVGVEQLIVSRFGLREGTLLQHLNA